MTTDAGHELEAALAEYSGNDPDDDGKRDPETPQDDPETVAPESPSQPGPTQPSVTEDPEPEEDKAVSFARETEAIVGDPSLITLESGLEVKIVRLRTREFFRLMKIVTHGAMPALMSMQIDFDLDDDAFMQRLLMVVLMAVPESEQETVDFIQSMCMPVGLNTGKNLTKAQIQQNVDKQIELDVALSNPELDDTLAIVESVIRQESEDIKALGKRLGKMWDLAVKTGQVPKPESTENSPS